MQRKFPPFSRVDVPAGVSRFFSDGRLPSPPGIESRAVVRECRIAVHVALREAGDEARGEWRGTAMRLVELLGDVLVEDANESTEARIKLAEAIAAGWQRWP